MSAVTESPRPLALSVLDLIPVRTNQSSADAVAASIELAKVADDLGFVRFWVAEHHNMPSIASTSPPVVMGVLAANTSRIRVGSGGVMLPNHSPFVVAEQFALLEAAFPGRIDLGIGRAPGSDPVITALLRSSGPTSDVDAFEQNVRDILAMMDRDGATLRVPGGREYPLHATPKAAGVATPWLLGSSEFSARLAARLGVPYVFASHFSGVGTDRSLDLYREGFAPSEFAEEPTTFLTANVVVAPTREEASAEALPSLQRMARLRTGAPLGPLATIEEAAVTEVSPLQQELIDKMLESWVIDEPSAAAERIRALADRFAVDEVMLVPGGSDPADAPVSGSLSRVRTIELLAEQLMVPVS